MLGSSTFPKRRYGYLNALNKRGICGHWAPNAAEALGMRCTSAPAAALAVFEHRKAGLQVRTEQSNEAQTALAVLGAQ